MKGLLRGSLRFCRRYRMWIMRRWIGLAVLGLLVGTLPSQGQSLDHWETVIYDNDTTWTYLVPTSPIPSDWTSLSFPATDWQTGPGGFGYGDGDDNTLIPEQSLSVYQRMTFEIADTSIIATALLHVDYDDAYVAYLNGTEIARRNIGTPGGAAPAFNATADTPHEAGLFLNTAPEGVILNKMLLRTLLNEGENVLAVQTHNANVTSSDFTSRVFFSVGLSTANTVYRPTPSWFEPPLSTSLSSNLPLVIIDTNGAGIPDEPKILAHMGIIDNGPGQRNTITDAFNDYDGTIGIERRGSSSQSFPKLSYAVELRNPDGTDLSASILGLPEEEDWILHGPYSDKSLMRNYLIFTLANRMGGYHSRTRYVEVVLNGDYRGVYVLMERIKRDKNRVAISKLNPDEIIGDDLTGGYIIKIDKVGGAQVDGWFSDIPPRPGLDQRVYYQYHYPKPSDIVPEQQAYIQGVVEQFEEVMLRSDFNDPVSGYTQYIDVPSAIDFYILNEISRNVDGYRLSTFLHKEKDSIGGGKLVFGPIWDFNLAFGNADYYGGGEPQGFQTESGVPDFDGFQPPFWWEKLWTDSTFNAHVQTRWTALRQTILHTDSLIAHIDANAALLQEASGRNFNRWPIFGTYVWPNRFVGNSYGEEVDYLRRWIRQRMGWIDANLRQVTVSTTLPPLQAELSEAFPNPALDDVHFTLSVPFNQQVRATLFDALGRELQPIYSGLIEAGGPQILTVPATALASGTYLLRVTGISFNATRRFVKVR